MARSRHATKKKADPEQPRTRLRLDEHLGGFSLVDLGREMGVVYTQLYPYRKPGANPTLLVLEKLVAGLSRLRGRKITVMDLLKE